jgi:hypothetical protein
MPDRDVTLTASARILAITTSGNDAGLLLHHLANSGEEYDLLLRPAVFLVDSHDVEQAVSGENTEKLRGRKSCDARI